MNIKDTCLDKAGLAILWNNIVTMIDSKSGITPLTSGVLSSYDKKENACWFTTDDGKFYVDAKDSSGTLTRFLLNAGKADSVPWSGITSKPSYYDAKAIKSITRSGTTFTYTCLDGTIGTFTQQDNNTTYSAGTGISLSGTTFSNSGVRSIATGSTNGTISVNTNGTAAEVAVKGLGSAAYTSSSDYLSTVSGGTVNAQVMVKGNFILRKASWHTISFQNSSGTALATMGMNNTDEAYGKVIIRVYSAASTYSTFSFENDGTFTGTKVKGAVWNDYAEYRQGQKVYQPGTCVIEVGDDTLIESTERLQGGALIVSDTFGFAIGETDEAKTPIATSGRVLAYTFEPRESYLPGDPVCSGPNGTVSKMTEQEVMMYPHKMIGTVSSIPDYEEWGTGKVKVDGRIWIQIC